MAGEKIIREKKSFYLLTLGILCIVAGQLVSCVTGSGAPAEQKAAAEPVSASASIAEVVDDTGMSEVKVVDVTDYYSRPEIAAPGFGRGLATFESENFIGSARCAVCHEKLTDKEGNDMSISGHWRSAMMANAARDPLWRAKVSSEVKRNPALKKVIESKCATCHMPMAWTETYEDGADPLVLDPGFLSPKNKRHAEAMDGVSCSLCHQIQNENMDKEESFSGKFVIDTETVAPDREIFGPYEDPVQEVMRQAVGYTPTFGAHINHSALCATCHTLYTPFVDAEGNVAGEFPEQLAYVEWKHSDYGVDFEKRYEIGENPGEARICQECHMPHSEAGEVYIANWAPPKTEPKDHFSQHHFVGGNAFMINILQDNIGSLDLSASTEKFEDTKERTMRQLQHETAELLLEDLRQTGQELTAVLKVENMAGHKLPTGIPIRRTWLHFTVADAAGEVVFESGKPLMDGRIEGNDADGNIRSYEPHYSVITRPDQVQIYEGVMLNTDNEVTYTLLRAAKFAKDNRLLPRGFNKDAVPADIGVYGRAATDKDFVGGSDRITYRVDASGYQGPFTVTARLLFTAVSYPFIKDLEEDSDLTEVRLFMQLYRDADRMPQEIAAIRATRQ